MRKLSTVLPALAIVGALGSTACVTGARGVYRSPSARGRVDDRAYQIGFSEGRSRGENDARRGRGFDYGRYDEYRDADRGYEGYGNRGEYRQVFRRGFVDGYNAGYRAFDNRGRRDRDNRYDPRDGRYDPRGTYASPAAQNGYRDGFDQGRDDGRDGDRFDPVRAERYRDGDHGYDSRYGSRDQYKREYRAAFQEGYDRGYREARR